MNCLVYWNKSSDTRRPFKICYIYRVKGALTSYIEQVLNILVVGEGHFISFLDSACVLSQLPDVNHRRGSFLMRLVHGFYPHNKGSLHLEEVEMAK